MSAELAVLSKIKENRDMYCIDNELFDGTTMLDISGIFPKAIHDVSTVDVGDIFEDGSCISTFPFNDNLNDLNGANTLNPNGGLSYVPMKFGNGNQFSNGELSIATAINMTISEGYALSLWATKDAAGEMVLVDHFGGISHFFLANDTQISSMSSKDEGSPFATCEHNLGATWSEPVHFVINRTGLGDSLDFWINGVKASDKEIAILYGEEIPSTRKIVLNLPEIPAGFVAQWGYNYNGNLANGARNTTNPYQDVKGEEFVFEDGVKKVAYSVYSWALAFVLTKKGDIWYSGRQVNLDAALEVTTWTKLDDNKYKDMFSANEGTYFIASDDTFWYMGFNTLGETGNGYANKDTTYPRPAQISTDKFKSFSPANHYQAAALKLDGTAWAYGQPPHYLPYEGNRTDFLNDGGTDEETYDSFQIGTDSDWTQVEASGDYMAAIMLKGDGTLWTWGYPWEYLLGQADTNIYNQVPTQVGTDTDWVKLSTAIIGTVLALKSDGTVWNWGSEQAQTESFVPIQLDLGTLTGEAIDIHCGNDWNFAVRMDDGIWYSNSFLQSDLTEIYNYDNNWVEVDPGGEWTGILLGYACAVWK